MNNDKQKLDLEGLLAEVEHAGRDARRRQELGAMIDGMAEKGRGKRGFWWWSVRVAAAACVLFFVSTAVRIWFIPTDAVVADNRVAQADMPVRPEPEVMDGPDALVPCPDAPVKVRKVMTESVDATIAAPEECLVEEMPTGCEEAMVDVSDNVVTVETADVHEQAPIVQADIQQPSTVEDLAVPVVSVEVPEATVDVRERKPRLKSFLDNILHRVEPSKMDGTMLALNIL